MRVLLLDQSDTLMRVIGRLSRRGGLGRPNVIADKRRDSDDDDDEFVTKEEDLPPPPEPAPKPRGVAENAEEEGDHGNEFFKHSSCGSEL